jgi:hypothetical protein
VQDIGFSAGGNGRARRVEWHGTQAEYAALLDLVARHCSCNRGGGPLIDPCSLHRMIVEDQRAMDGLVFLRRLAGRLRVEEFGFVDRCE